MLSGASLHFEGGTFEDGTDLIIGARAKLPFGQQLILRGLDEGGKEQK